MMGFCTLKTYESLNIIKRCNNGIFAFNDGFYPFMEEFCYDIDEIDGKLTIYLKMDDNCKIYKMLKENSYVSALIIENNKRVLIYGIACILDEWDYCYLKKDVIKIVINDVYGRKYLK